MKRTLTVLLTVAMIVAVAAPAMAVAQPSAPDAAGDEVLAAEDDATTTENESAVNDSDETPPGAMLAGSIGVQESEMKGAIEQRAFGHQIRAAATNDSKAQVLNLTQERVQDRMTDLEERKARLDAARDNGTISESQYRAQVSVIAAESEQIRTMANETEHTAEQLPNETLEANGVNVTALEQVRERAHNMTGPEVSEIARQIAGDHVGEPMGPPENRPGGPQSGPQSGMGEYSGGNGGDRMTDENTTADDPNNGTDMAGDQSDGTTTSDE